MDIEEGELAWGGVERIGTLGSFYVSVNGGLTPLPGTNSLELINGTADTAFA